ncbi:MAG: hypothetical protein NXI04_22270 [Planctomycetaceae bacterium]|nr:hypothetical protein [Planctomycetaceae bacterium]
MQKYTLVFVLSLSAMLTATSESCGQHRKIATRIFWQDRDTDKLSYADLTMSSKWGLSRGWVNGFPELDAERQDLVQMKHCDGMLMVGIRDDDGGKHQSGWVAIDTGVIEEPHGNHTHWRYNSKPAVRLAKLDAEQGNPAHVYVYNRRFYLANDTKNGFTRAIPVSLKNKNAAASAFFPGGGNHITMAAPTESVAYSTWIDGGGPNAGRVDVVRTDRDKDQIAYSFKLPTGVIHGATSNSGRAFFAPADGICWVDVDSAVSLNADTVKVNHLTLGTDEETDKPLRTGAFENSRNWVLCSTGSGAQSALCMINAAAQTPAVIRLSIDLADGLRLMTPKTVMSMGRRYAFLFQDRTQADSDVQEQLTIVELDPNKDRDFSDARVKTTIPVGASRVEGHHGHHAIAFDAYGRHAIFTEPGTGILNVMAMPQMKVVARFTVGGSPDSIVAVGAPEHHH